MCLLCRAKLEGHQVIAFLILAHRDDFQLHGHADAKLIRRIFSQATLYFQSAGELDITDAIGSKRLGSFVGMVGRLGHERLDCPCPQCPFAAQLGVLRILPGASSARGLAWEGVLAAIQTATADEAGVGIWPSE